MPLPRPFSRRRAKRPPAKRILVADDDGTLRAAVAAVRDAFLGAIRRLVGRPA